MGASTRPAARATVFRTDPVLRAMGCPPRAGGRRSVAAAEPVPSLSVSPRFVLPLVRDAGKRVLAPLPPVPRPTLGGSLHRSPSLPLPLPHPRADRPAEPVVAAAVAPADRPTSSRPPPAVVAEAAAPWRPLTTAVLITPVLPRQQPPRLQARPSSRS